MGGAEKKIAGCNRARRVPEDSLASFGAASGEHHPKRVGPCLAVEGATTREVFEAYLEHVLAPILEPGQMMVMDNLSAHKGERVKEIIEGRGCVLTYLPPYLPDFNPIERAFAKWSHSEIL